MVGLSAPRINTKQLLDDVIESRLPRGKLQAEAVLEAGISCICKFHGTRGRPVLIIYDVDAIAFPAQPQHPEQEIVAVWTMDPTRSTDQKADTDLTNGFLAG